MFGLKIFKAPHIGRVLNSSEETRDNMSISISSKKLSTHRPQIPIILPMIILVRGVGGGGEEFGTNRSLKMYDYQREEGNKGERSVIAF